MQLNKSAVSAVCVAYMNLLMQTVTNTNLAIIHWRRRRNQRRKLQKLLLCLSISLDLALLEIIPNRMKSRHRLRATITKEWWEQILEDNNKDEEWFEQFRLTKETFNYLVEELKEELEPKNNALNFTRKIASLKKKVAISLYYLGNGADYSEVGNAFNIHKSTVYNIIHKFVLAVNKILLPKFIRMPNDKEAAEISSSFKEISNLPNIIGLIDFTHIPVTPCNKGYGVYVNEKGWTSVILQAVVDHRYRFLNICINEDGNNVLENSPLYQNIENMLPKATVILDENQTVPHVFVGDHRCPLMPWLIIPYSASELTSEQDIFNVHLIAVQVTAKAAFERLKARWKILLKRSDVAYNFVSDIVTACCVLHNITEGREDNWFYQKWMEDVRSAETIFPQPQKNKYSRAKTVHDAYKFRNILCNYLSSSVVLRS